MKITRGAYIEIIFVQQAPVSAHIQITKDTASAQQLEELDVITRAKNMFLTPSAAGYRAAKKLAAYKDILDQVKESAPSLATYPSEIEIANVMEHYAETTRSQLSYSAAIASTPEMCTLFSIIEVVDFFCSDKQLEQLTTDDHFGADFFFRVNYISFLCSYSKIRESLLTSSASGRNAAQNLLCAFQHAFQDTINNDHTLQVAYSGERVSFNKIQTDPYYTSLETSADRLEDLLSSPLGPRNPDLTGEYNYEELHEQAKLKLQEERRTTLDFHLAKPLNIVPTAILAHIANPRVLYRQFKREVGEKKLEKSSEKKRAVALAGTLRYINRSALEDRSSVFATVLESLKSVECHLQLQEAMFDSMKKVAVSPNTLSRQAELIKEFSYICRAMHENLEWIAAHVGEHFLVSHEYDPRG